MAKRRQKKAGGRLGDLAERLGTLLGTTERTARGWMEQRKQIAGQLSEVRDKADRLLRELTGGVTNVAGVMTRSRKTATRRKPSAAKRKTTTTKTARRTSGTRSKGEADNG